jgi:hypothetical protein
MAFIFTMRSTPLSSSHRRNPSNTTSLPAIDEDNASFLSNSTKPPVPPRAAHRPIGNGRYSGGGFGVGSAQGWIDSDAGSDPPSYNTSDDGRGEKERDRFAELRRGVEENRHISKRGGWRRLLLLLLLLLVIGIALGVGLGVGLKRRSGADS